MVIKFDYTGGVYEVFTKKGQWRGAFDTWAEAYKFTKRRGR